MGTLSAVFPFFALLGGFELPPGRERIWSGPIGHPTKDLSTYAIKDTVSVLYWYEKLSRNGNFLKRFSNLFFVYFFFISADR